MSTEPASLDIASALADWDHDADRVAVRIIRGDDHLPKMQMRLDLGLLQMETAGRPDGRRPRSFVSLLAYHMDRLEEHVLQSGSPREFVLSPRDCRQLRDEARMFSQRMLGWFVLGEWDLAEADVQLVRRSMEFVREHATEPRDRGLMLGWKPYVTMMHARCRAAILVGDEHASEAVRVVESALRKIGRYYRRQGGKAAYAASVEVRALRTLLRRLRKKVPVAPAVLLQRQLHRAVAAENYEYAAELRDRLGSI